MPFLCVMLQAIFDEITSVLTRRALLHWLASIPGLSALSAPAAAQGLGTDYDVIVIGAGVAGLAAADYLMSLDAELKVLVLEARDRMGGRVYSVDQSASGRDAELGALYLPPTDGADWAVLKQLGLRAQALDNGQSTLFPGMRSLVEALADASSGQLQLSSEVTEVYWREGLVGVSYKNRGVNSSVTSRRLLFTIPAAVLRDSPPQIVPPLGERKQRALASLSTESSVTAALVFSGQNLKLNEGRKSWFADTASTRLRAFSTGPDGEVLLEAQFSGAKAVALSGQPDRVILSVALQNFEEALATQPSLDDALWTASTDWLADRYSRGARPVASGTNQHLALAESVGSTLFFAGDATADPELVGTLRGAIASGTRAAQELALSLSVPPPPDDPNQPIFELL